ncbi:MAG: hypothetical protein CM1200mP4_4840 [Rhodospirillaceae bacterium]|nr:MAG: hypothetical protein CM1200mP4_4840 [Rhodospirillaceae bacterium]
MITGPGSPSVLASMIQAIEQHVDWIVDCIAHMRDTNVTTIEPTNEHEDNWVEHVTDVSKEITAINMQLMVRGSQKSPAAPEFLNAVYWRVPNICQ